MRVQQLQQYLAGTDLDDTMLEVQQGSSKPMTKDAVFTMETPMDLFGNQFIRWDPSIIPFTPLVILVIVPGQTWCCLNFCQTLVDKL